MGFIKLLPALINGVLFTGVAAFHYYWAFGGKTGMNVAVPQIESTGKKAFVPGKAATFAVATLFSGVAILFFLIGFRHKMWDGLQIYFLYAIAIITSIRALGDFKYVGFFKKVKDTPFAKYDTGYFSPLCLLIALFSILQLLIVN